MNSLPYEVLCILLGHLEVLDAFRTARVCKQLRFAAMSMIGATLADFTALPVTVKDRFRTSVISPDNMKILKRYRAIDVSRTSVTAEDILKLIRCGITVITIYQCFHIDKRLLLSGLREYGAENPDVFVSLHTARSTIGMWLNLRSDLVPYAGNAFIYDDNAPNPKYDLLLNMPSKEGEGRVCHICGRETSDGPSGAGRCDDCGRPTCTECESIHCSYGVSLHRCCTLCLGRYKCLTCDSCEIQCHHRSSYRGVRITRCGLCPSRACQNCPRRPFLCAKCRAWLCPECTNGHTGVQCYAMEQSRKLDIYAFGQ